MNPAQLLAHLDMLGVRLTIDGDQLRYRAPRGTLSADLAQALREHKTELLRLLDGTQSLTPLQSALWFLSQIEPGCPAYNTALACHLRGGLRVEHLEWAVCEIVKRHEPLRFAFTAVDGAPVRRVVAPMSLPLQRRQAASLAEALHECGVEAGRPFDAARPPLLRATVWRLDEHAHVLLLVTHHLAADGWSLRVLAQDLEALYNACGPVASMLAPLPMSYTAYESWRTQQLGERQVQGQVAYWQSVLGTQTPPPELPRDRPLRPLLPSRGSTVGRRVPTELRRDLLRLAGDEGVSLFALLLSGFALLLGRYCRQAEVLVGTAVSQRDRWEAEALIGPLSNNLVLRVGLPPTATARRLLRDTHATIVAALAHKDLPYETMVQAVFPGRDLSRDPLFRASFVYQDAPSGVLALDGLEVDFLDVDSGLARFDLSLAVSEADGALALACEFSAEAFGRETIDRLLANYETLLRSIVTRPDERVGELRLLTEDERRAVVSRGASGAQATESHQFVHESVERWAREQPAALAVAAPDARLTYSELNDRAEAVAVALRQRDVGLESRVVLCMPPSVDWIVAMLAVLKCGGTYVPLDPALPATRTRAIVEDLGNPLVIGSLDADLGRPEPSAEPATCDPLARSLLTPDHLAYAVFSSGSTGAPNGIEIPHLGLTNMSAWYVSAFEVRPGDRLSQVAAPGFDAALFEIWPALTGGASLHLAPVDVRQSTAGLRSWMSAEGISIAFLPTPLLQLFLQSDGEPLALRVLHAGGDTLRRRPPPGAAYRLINNYGPSEYAVLATSGEVRAGDVDEPPDLGGPIANTAVYVLDDYLEPVPTGAIGEVVLGGEGLARGYTNRPALTAERFVPDPFSGRLGARLFRTRDLARWRSDGSLEFRGRRDLQVKLRGYRVELGEIETTLAAHPAIAHCAAVARTSAAGSVRLAAFYVPSGAAPRAEELRAYLAARLPEYMVPMAIVALPRLPLTPNGKIDRAALPDPADIPDADPVSPRTATERTLAALWRQVLNVDRVGIHDSFFSAGGDSILALTLSHRANQAGLPITPRTILEHPTIASMAAAVGTEAHSAAGTTVDQPGPAPLTPIQRWFFAQDFAESWHWNQAVVLDIAPELSLETWRAALDEVVRRHAALRHAFTPGADGWQQEPREVSVATRCASLADFDTVAQEVQRSLDPTQGRLVACAWFGASALVAIHHLAVDAVSWHIVLEELHSLCAGEPVSPPGPPYRAWARRLHAQDSHLAPSRRAARRPGDTVAHARSLAATLDRPTTERLLRSGQVHEILLAALVAARGPLQVDVETHGRNTRFSDLDISRTVGWFTALRSMRLNAADPRHVADAFAQADWLTAESASPVCFNYLGQLSTRIGPLFSLSARSAGPLYSPRSHRPWELEVNSVVWDGELMVNWTYPSNRFAPELVDAWASTFLAAVRRLVGAQANESGYAASISDRELDEIASLLGSGGGL